MQVFPLRQFSSSREESGSRIQLNDSLIPFYQWFVGFCDAESSFMIQPVLDSNNVIRKITWKFSIELHIDDLEVLKYIKSNLGLGNIRINKNKCIFTITDSEGTNMLIAIFDKYNLNTTKFLDYLNFKESFLLYQRRNKQIMDIGSKIELANRILQLKNSMNTKRTNSSMPLDHKINISKAWLLGYIEGDGSFFISRTDIEPVFSLSATEEQYDLYLKIKEFLIANLGFDKYSLFKLNSSQAIAINLSKARNNGKPTVSLIIKNVKLLNNYFIPFFDDLLFISKKGLDFKDFKLICAAVYNGLHKSEEIRSLILKLSYNMNNFRLSTSKQSSEVLNLDQRDKIAKASPLFKYLDDGRILDLTNNSIITKPNSLEYEVITPEKDVILFDSLKEVLAKVGVGFRTMVSAMKLDSGERVEIKGYIVKRIPVFGKKLEREIR